MSLKETVETLYYNARRYVYLAMAGTALVYTIGCGTSPNLPRGSAKLDDSTMVSTGSHGGIMEFVDIAHTSGNKTRYWVEGKERKPYRIERFNQQGFLSPGERFKDLDQFRKQTRQAEYDSILGLAEQYLGN